MKSYISFFIIALVLSFVVSASTDSLNQKSHENDFIRVGQWNHGEYIFTTLLDTIIDKDGDMLGAYVDTEKGYFLTTPEKLINFAPIGQGPSDLTNFNFVHEYKGNMAILESIISGKMKIFNKKNGTYVWQATKWFKRGKNAHFVTDGIFINEKWFFAGYGQVNTGRKFYLKPFDVFYLQVFDDQGKSMKRLLTGRVGGQNYYYQKYFFLDKYKGKVFFAAEDELEIKIICPKEIKLINTVNLKKPSFYKRMPAEYYQFNKYGADKRQFIRDLQHWKGTYSAITKMLVEGDQLVIQVRTCSDDLKKFALLFYEGTTFKLQKTVYIDDYLLAAKNGKYYFFANGDPWFDDDTENCIINIYSFKGKK